MTSTSMNDLPIEIHISILTSLLSFSLQPAGLSDDPTTDPIPVSLEWTEADTRSKSLFPFNVASVCRLWCDILSQIPECWTRVVFDVTADPTRFLDAFLWSKNLEKIEVVVFSSLDNGDEVDKALENRRVLAIARALQPHVHRCKSIIFDVAYSSSLPPPTIVFLHHAPDLEELLLDSRVDDIDLEMLEIEQERPILTGSCPQLWNLSITGSWFMNMAQRAPNTEWLEELACNENMEFHISRHKFPEHGPYSLQKFVTFLPELQWCESLYLHDLSLAYSWPYNRPSKATSASLTTVNLHFQSVSKDFISHLYSLITPSPDGFISFEDCEIPNIMGYHDSSSLSLAYIPDEDSIRNVLRNWCGSALTIRSCTSFNDTILSWLFKKADDFDPDSGPRPFFLFPANFLRYLTLEDCHDFTVRALGETFRDRNVTLLASVNILGMRNVLIRLEVAGNIPSLTQENKDWFTKTYNLNVTWVETREYKVTEPYRRKFLFD